MQGLDYRLLKVQNHLVGLASGVLMPRDTNDGICKDLKDRFGFIIPKEYFESWMRYSGDPVYPVPGGMEPYRKHNALWVSKQGRYRRELCSHLALELKHRPDLAMEENGYDEL